MIIYKKDQSGNILYDEISDNNRSLYNNSTLLNSDKLISDSAKIQTLNTYKQRIHDVRSDERLKDSPDSLILNSLDTIELTINDAYKISMYKFAFKLLTSVLEKEISNIEKMVEFND